MGWYALYKWYKPWSKRDLPNMIYWYKEYVLKTPEQREAEAIKRKKEAQTIMAQLGVIHAMLSDISNK